MSSFPDQLLVAQVTKGLGNTPASVGNGSSQITGQQRRIRQPQAHQQRCVSISRSQQELQGFSTWTEDSGKTQQCLDTAGEDGDGVQLLGEEMGGTQTSTALQDTFNDTLKCWLPVLVPAG